MRAAAPEGAKLFTDNYLHWAAEERSRSTLVIPDLAGDPRPALAALVEVPGPWDRRIRVVNDSRADASFGPPSPLPLLHVRPLRRSDRAPIPSPGGLLPPEGRIGREG